MKLMARIPGGLDGILRCAECKGPMVLVGKEYRCPSKLEPEELVAVGFLPLKDPSGKISFTFEFTTKDQQQLQITQAFSQTVEIDDAFLVSLRLDLRKIRDYQLKHGTLP